MRRTLIFASLLLALPAFAGAQHRGGTVGGGTAGAVPVSAGPGPAGHATAAAPHAMASAAHPVARVAAGMHVAMAAPVGVRRVQVNGTVNRRVSVASGLRNLPLFPTNSVDTPGLGFDFPHLAAINAGQGSGRGHQRFDRGGGFGFGGFLLSPGVIMMEPQPGESVPGAEESAAANAGGADNERDFSDQFLPAQATPSAPIRDSAEYVFVRRDGGLLFAVAYSWDNGTLRYVTRDGLRRSVTQDKLDMEATQQFNEQRGLNFHVPA